MAYKFTPMAGAPPLDPRYQKLAEAMQMRGLDPGITMGGVGGIAQGLGALAQAYAGKSMMNDAETAQTDRNRQLASILAQSFMPQGQSGGGGAMGYAPTGDAELDGKIAGDQLMGVGPGPSTAGQGGAGIPPDMQRYQDLIMALGPETVAPYALDRMFGSDDLVQVVENGKKVWKRKSQAAGAQSDFPEAGKTRERIQGGMLIQEQFNPATGQWEQYGGGARWAPQQPAADSGAWETVDIPGVGKVQRNKRTGKIEGLPSQGGNITPSQTAANAEIDAARKYLTNSNLSMDEITRRTQEQTATGRENPDYDPYLAQTFRLGMSRKVGDDPEFDTFQQKYRGSPAGPQDIPRTSGGQIDPDKLTVGGVYTMPGGGKFQWTGQDFIQVP